MIRIEFQVRYSSHINSILRIVDAPVLTTETIELDKHSADGLILVKLPDYNQDPNSYKPLKSTSYKSTQKHVENVENLKMVHVNFVLTVINIYLVYE